IKDMTTGEFVDSASIEMSSIKGTRSFKAIGFNNGTEVGPVAASWSLIGGDVASGSIREGILKKLNVNVGKIGVFATAEGAKSSVENSEQVDFVSYLSSTPTGDIRIQAAYGSLTPVEVSIRLKQPKISIKINKLDTVSDSPLLDEWKRVAVETWTKENLLAVEFVNSAPDIISNEILSNPQYLANSLEQYFSYFISKKTYVDLDYILVYDYVLSDFYNVEIAYTRQLEKILSKSRGTFKTITVAITNNLYVSARELDVSGWTSHSKKTQKRITPSTPIDNPIEAGITLKYHINYNIRDTISLAHEIGHILIRTSDDHLREDNTNWNSDNLMNEFPQNNNLEPIQWIYALGLHADISYFIKEE
ncbi:MAG: hypothetical protein II961_08670, partial [Candidatus Riflebacteria bacterium]|nr:hypothetical protein [Candidatus Riflebacteria bacterium]